jgi:hypothetical protein
MADRPELCEWPARIGETLKCGKPAKARVVLAWTESDRYVCGVHRRRAEGQGWVLLDPEVSHG